MGNLISLLARFPIYGGAYLSLHWSGEGGKNSIALIRAMNTSAVVTLGGVQVSALEGRSWPVVILSHMVVVIVPANQSRARPRTRAQRRSWTRTTPFSGQIARVQQRGLVIMHGFVALFLGVIALAIILLVVELGALWVLVVALRAVVAYWWLLQLRWSLWC